MKTATIVLAAVLLAACGDEAPAPPPAPLDATPDAGAAKPAWPLPHGCDVCRARHVSEPIAAR
jgi:hypothetical protein